MYTMTVETSDGGISAHTGDSIDWEIKDGVLSLDIDNNKGLVLYAPGFWHRVKYGV